MELTLKNIVVFIFILFVLVTPAFSQTDDVQVSIRFYNKQLYRIDSNIYIKIEITNNSPSPFRFELSDYRVFNIDFDLRTEDNRQLPHTERFKTRKNTNQPVFFRTVTLETGERYGFIEDVTDYIKIDSPGAYYLNTLFYPTLDGSGEITPLRSNTLQLTIRPLEEKPELETEKDYETMAELKRQSLSPDEVVSFTLRARQRSQWDRFFLYLDVESLLRRNQTRERRFLRLSEEEQRVMLQNYRDQLKAQTVDGDIVVVPQDFRIIKTTYTPTEGTVKAELEFEYPEYTEIKEYTYYVRFRNDVWFIYDYEVRNVGTK